MVMRSTEWWVRSWSGIDGVSVQLAERGSEVAVSRRCSSWRPIRSTLRSGSSLARFGSGSPTGDGTQRRDQ
eukprot:7864310-Pyramimonas_sp.AAC.1